MGKRDREQRAIRYSDPKKVSEDRDVGFQSKAIKLPEGVPLFRWEKAKTYRIEILPYITGKGNPMADEGVCHFERTYYVHKGIGPKKDTVLCNGKTLNEKCPVCEHRDRLLNDPESNKKLTDALKYKERQLFIVRDLDEPDKGIQVLETAYYKSFGELLENKTDAGDDDQPFHNFHHLEDGMILKVTTKEDTFEGKKYNKPVNIEMIPRKKALDPSILEEVPCLDDIPVKADYKELKKSFLQIPEDDDDDDTDDGTETEDEDDEEGESSSDKKSGKKSSEKKTPKKSGSQSKTSDVEDEDEDDEEETESDDSEDDTSEDAVEFSAGDKVSGEYKDKKFTGVVKKIANGLVHVTTKAGNLRVMDPDDLTLIEKAKKAEADEDEDDEEGEDEEPKSGKTSKPTSKKPSKDEDEDDDDEDEKPAKKPGKKKPAKEEDEDEDLDLEDEDEDEDEEEDDD